MAIEELTDRMFFDLYQKKPKIRELVDDVQKKHGVHASQKGKPEYTAANIPTATQEAKEAVKTLLSGQSEAVQKAKTTPSGGILAGRMDYAAGLFGILLAIGAMSAGVPYVPPPLY